MTRLLSFGGAVSVATVLVLTTACATTPGELSDADVERIADRVAERLQPAAPAVRSTQPVTYVPVPAAAQPTRAVRHTPTTRAVYPGAPNPQVFGTVPDVAARDARSMAARSVDAALVWLSRHQAPNGSWSADGFGAQCDGPKCSGPGDAHYTPGLTGLAVLCFLGDGHGHRGGKYGAVVDKALHYLRNIQDPDGCFGPRLSQHFMYNHALASLAMVEAHGTTGSPIFKASAQQAVNFIHHAQNPYLGWRYGIRDGDNDTSMTAWMTMVLASARQAGLDVDEAQFRGARSWVDKMTEPEFGRVGYNRRGGPTARTMEAMDKFPPEHSEAMTAAGLLIRLHSGQAATEDFVQKGANLLVTRPPTWNVESGTNDFYYWQLGTAAMRRIGGPGWAKWRSALMSAVPRNQHQGAGDIAGSWDPVDPWSADGGRIYATTSICLALQQVEHGD